MISTIDTPMTLTKLVESRIRELTHGRIWNLQVEEVKGQVVVRGRAPSQHARQLALYGALEVLPEQSFSTEIVVATADVLR